MSTIHTNGTFACLGSSLDVRSRGCPSRIPQNIAAGTLSNNTSSQQHRSDAKEYLGGFIVWLMLKKKKKESQNDG